MYTIVKKALVVMALVSLVAVSANAAYYGAPIRLRTHYNTLRTDVDCKEIFRGGVYLADGQLVSDVTSKVTSDVISEVTSDVTSDVTSRSASKSASPTTSRVSSRVSSGVSSRVSSKVTSQVALPARLQYAIRKACKL